MLDTRKTVNDMYQYSKAEGSMLLSSFGAENEGFLFWDEYREKHRRYDKLFNRMFNSFKYFMQNEEQTIAEITEDFTDEVYNHLMINAKKYEELYRVNVINDSDYSILDNYNITETMDKETGREGSTTYGEREDVTTKSYGLAEHEHETVYGQNTTNYNSTKGSQTDSHVDDIAGFNSDTYAKDSKTSDTYGQRQDTSSEINLTHTDTTTLSDKAHEDTDTLSKGEQVNSTTDSATEDYTLTRRGNIGVRTITEVIEYHEKFWTTYEFYTLIFKEICAELLLI